MNSMMIVSAVLTFVLCTTIVDECTACDTTAMNSCVEEFVNDSSTYTQGNIFDASTFNTICSLLSTEASCIANASCTNEDVNSGDNTNINAGNIHGYQYLCNLSSADQQTFLSSMTCFYTAASAGGTGGAFQACYNNTIGAYTDTGIANNTAFCLVQNSYNACQRTAIEAYCSRQFANIYVTWTMRMSQIQFTAIGCTLYLPSETTMASVTTTTAQTGDANVYHVNKEIVLPAVIGLGLLVANRFQAP